MNFATDIPGLFFTEIGGCRTVLPKHFRSPNHTITGSLPRVALVNSQGQGFSPGDLQIEIRSDGITLAGKPNDSENQGPPFFTPHMIAP